LVVSAERNNGSGTGAKMTYEAPALQALGSFHVETQSGCLFGKQWGGHDTFAGIVGVPISNCSG
jgi:hypothetical protein